MNKKSIVIFGSTGSIGKNAINLLQKELENEFEIALLTCQNNTDELVRQIHILKPLAVGVSDVLKAKKLQDEFPDLRVLAGDEEINLYVQDTQFHTCLLAISGFAALKPVLSIMPNIKRLCVANKEVIVSAWTLLKSSADMHKVEIIPVDSEHNSIFRLLEGFKDGIASICLTASGGALLNTPINELENITRTQALSHPNWQMGHKITVDCSTMANKGLELIEACRLFEMCETEVEVLIHPQSIVHGMVSFTDKSAVAFMSAPDMRIHILHALKGGQIHYNTHTERLNLAKLKSLDFMDIDHARFPMLKLAREVSGSEFLSLIFNTANEMAVERFLAGRIKFTEIYKLTAQAIETHTGKPSVLQTLEDLTALDLLIRRFLPN
jgi:1-deoxy-D-xylulose-5-phosphate reductoisomerase